MDTIYSLDELPKHLDSIPKASWEDLFSLIPRIERVDLISGWITGDEGFTLQEETTDLIHDFIQRVYGMGLIIDFDWRNWDEAEELIHNVKTDCQRLSPITLCKLLTYHVRLDRFCGGHLASCFRTGLTTNILKALSEALRLMRILNRCQKNRWWHPTPPFLLYPRVAIMVCNENTHISGGCGHHQGQAGILRTEK